jgi:hypothetical protein
MNWIKSPAMHAKTLAWLIAFGTSTVCCAQAQPTASNPPTVASSKVLPPLVPVSPPTPASAANTPLAVQLTNWPAHESTFAIDVIKAAIGAFLGAGLAFFSSYVQRRLQRRKEDIAAGNLNRPGICGGSNL